MKLTNNSKCCLREIRNAHEAATAQRGHRMQNSAEGESQQQRGDQDEKTHLEQFHAHGMVAERGDTALARAGILPKWRAGDGGGAGLLQ